MEDHDLVRRLGVLGQETRVAILRALSSASDAGMAQRELSLCVGMEQNAASYHLKLLVETGLVEAEKRGRAMLYRIAPAEIDRLAADILDLGGSVSKSS